MLSELSEWLFEIHNTSDPVIIPLRDIRSGEEIRAFIRALRGCTRKRLEILSLPFAQLYGDLLSESRFTDREKVFNVLEVTPCCINGNNEEEYRKEIIPLYTNSEGEILEFIHVLRKRAQQMLDIRILPFMTQYDDVAVLLKVQSVFDVERFLSEVQQYFDQKGSLCIVISTHAAEKLLAQGVIDDYRKNPSDKSFGGKPASEASFIAPFGDVELLVATQTANQYAIYSQNSVQLYVYG